jgi:hypothetical protein
MFSASAYAIGCIAVAEKWTRPQVEIVLARQWNSDEIGCHTGANLNSCEFVNAQSFRHAERRLHSDRRVAGAIKADIFERFVNFF